MNRTIHRQITEEALGSVFQPAALEEIVIANLRQDRLVGQVGHPEFHFDSNTFEKGWGYMDSNRQQVISALEHAKPLDAWHAFGRLTHAGQDFYAHSNYVTRWLERYPADALPAAEEIDPLDEALLSAGLRSGKIYLPWEPLSWIPAIRDPIMRLMPRDSHAWMNMDSPEQGPAFVYARAAAVKRTVLEYERILPLLSEEMRSTFCGGTIRAPRREV